jgi:hypothetical protein
MHLTSCATAYAGLVKNVYKHMQVFSLLTANPHLSLTNSRTKEHIREKLLTMPWVPKHEPPSEPHDNGRKGLYSPICWSSYRPKFICPRRTCRRSIKPFYAPDINEYDISKGQTWKVRPLPERMLELEEALRRWVTIGRKPPPQKLVERSYDEDKAQLAAFRTHPENFSDEEHEEVMWAHSEAWFIEIKKRFPSRGQAAVPVGSNFQIPGKRDEKGCRQVEAWIDAGEALEIRKEQRLNLDPNPKFVLKGTLYGVWE